MLELKHIRVYVLMMKLSVLLLQYAGYYFYRGESKMLDFIKSFFKFFFGLALIVSLVVGVGVAVFAYVFKKDFEDIERRTKEIVSDIESGNE